MKDEQAKRRAAGESAAAVRALLARHAPRAAAPAAAPAPRPAVASARPAAPPSSASEAVRAGLQRLVSDGCLPAAEVEAMQARLIKGSALAARLTAAQQAPGVTCSFAITR